MCCGLPILLKTRIHVDKTTEQATSHSQIRGEKAVVTVMGVKGSTLRYTTQCRRTAEMQLLLQH